MTDQYLSVKGVLWAYAKGGGRRRQSSDAYDLKFAVDVHAIQICAAASGQFWKEPGKLESDLEALRRDLRSLRVRIGAVDPRAMMYARQEAAETFSAMDDLQPNKPEEARSVLEVLWKPTAKSEWVDYAAISAIHQLEKALVRPIEMALKSSSMHADTGRPPHLIARHVALRAVYAYRELRGTPGRSRKNPLSTPIGRMVQELFELLEVRSSKGGLAGIESPLNWALDKLRENEQG